MNNYARTLQSNRFDHFDRLGSFNPGLLLIEQNGRTDYEKQLIWGHEYKHAKLSASILGRSIVFLQYIIIDMLLDSINKPVNQNRLYLSYIQLLEEKISQLIQDWAFLQEGIATFKDYETLKRSESEESNNLLTVLKKVLQQENIYSKGFKLIRAFSETFNTTNTSPFHLFGNLPFQFDDGLNLHYHGRTLQETITYFYSAIVKINARDFHESLESKDWNRVSACLNRNGFETEPTPNLSHSFFGFIDSMLEDKSCPKQYKVRLEDIKDSYQSNTDKDIQLTRVASKIAKDKDGCYQLIVGMGNSSDVYEKNITEELNAFLKISFLKKIVYETQSITAIREHCEDSVESDDFSLIIQTYFPS